MDSFEIGQQGHVTLDAASQVSYEWSNVSYIYTQQLDCAGQLNAGLLSVDLPENYHAFFYKNVTKDKKVSNSDTFNELTVSGSFVFEAASDFDVFVVEISGWFETHCPISMGVPDALSLTSLVTSSGSTVLFNSLNKAVGPSGLSYSELFLTVLQVAGIFKAKEVDICDDLVSVALAVTGQWTMTSIGKNNAAIVLFHVLFAKRYLMLLPYDDATAECLSYRKIL